MLKFWKNAGKGKSGDDCPPNPSNPSPSGSTDGFPNSPRFNFDTSDLQDDGGEERSRLSKNLKDTLSDKHSLAYFVDFAESGPAAADVQFWLEVQKFKDSASGLDKIPHRTLNRTVSFDSSLISPDGPAEKNAILDRAVSIFKTYVALESPRRINFPEDVRNAIVSSICRPDGTVRPDIFETAENHVLEEMSSDRFQKYAESDFHRKYQLDVLTGGGLTVEDIIYDQTALFYFMEFLEQERCNVLLEFVMAVINFKEQMTVNADADREQAQNDAIILYDKYFSLQATHPLGFPSEVRFHIEEKICEEDGPSPDCFHRPFRIVLRALRQHIRGFMTSQIFYKYLTELVGSIQGGWQTVSKHKRSPSDCSSGETSSKNAAGAARSDGESASSMRIDLKQLYNGDLLWRRKSDRGLCLGRVNSLGKFESSMEPDPERKDPSILKRVVNKLVHGERDKEKEELAWQVAHMIVKDVTDVTMGIPEGQL